MIKAVSNASFGSQSTTTQEEKKPSVVVPTIAGGLIGGGVTAIAPFGKSNEFKDADTFMKSDKAKEALEKVSGDDNAADKKTLEEALNKAKTEHKGTIDKLFPEKVEEVEVSKVLDEIEHEPKFEDLKNASEKSVDDVFKTQQEELDAVKKAKDELENGKSKKIDNTDLEVFKDSEGKVTVKKGKTVNIPEVPEKTETVFGESQKLPTEKIKVKSEIKIAENAHELQCKSTDLGILEQQVHLDESVKKAAKDIKEGETTVVYLKDNKAAQLSSKNGMITIVHGTAESVEKIDLKASPILAPIKFASVKDMNAALNDNLESDKKIKAAVAKGLKEGEPITVNYETDHAAQITKKGEEIHIEYGTVEKSYVPVEKTQPVELSPLEKKVKEEGGKLTAEKPSTTIDHTDGQKIEITKTADGITYKIGTPKTTPKVEATTKFDGTTRTLEEMETSLSKEKNIFEKNKNIAEALGITKDSKPDAKVKKDAVEKALNKATSTLGENVTKAFNNLQKHLGQKTSWVKVGIATAGCALIAGVAASMIGGNKNQE